MALLSNIMIKPFDLQAVLHGTQRVGGAPSNAMFSCNLHANDGHRAMDLLVCSSQNPEGMSSY